MSSEAILKRGCLFALVILAAALCNEATGQGTARSAEPATDDASVPTGSADAGHDREGQIKVLFDQDSPGIVIVESNGQRFRIDTTKKTVEPLALKQPVAVRQLEKPGAIQTERQAAEVTPREDPQEESAYDFDSGDEPYDYRLINVPTPKKVPKGTWNLSFTHRFTRPVHPISSSADELFGLDSFGVASFGVSYGITDKLYVTAYRSPLCMRGLCRTIEVGAGYNFLEQDKDSRFALAAYGSMEGNENFREEYTFNLQARIAARLNKRVYLFFSPAIHINANGQRRFDPRPNDFFPPAEVAETFRQPTHGASFGFGTSVLITPTTLALFEFTPRTGFKLGNVRPIFDSNFNVTGFQNESHPEIGFGIQRNIGRHSFSLTFSNTQTTTTSRYNSSNLGFSPKRLVIGFNLSRRF